MKIEKGSIRLWMYFPSMGIDNPKGYSFPEVDGYVCGEYWGFFKANNPKKYSITYLPTGIRLLYVDTLAQAKAAVKALAAFGSIEVTESTKVVWGEGYGLDK